MPLHMRRLTKQDEKNARSIVERKKIKRKKKRLMSQLVFYFDSTHS